MGLTGTIQKAVGSGFGALGDLKKTVTHIRAGTPVYDPATGSETGVAETTQANIKAVIAGYKNFEINGAQIVVGDRKVLVPAGSLQVEPKVNDKIEFDGVKHQVKNVGKDPAGAMYILQVGN